MENEELKSHQTERQPETDLRHEQILLEEEEDEEEEEEEELCGSELWEAWDDECPSQGKCCALRPTLRDLSLGKRHCTRPVSLDLGALLSHSIQDEDGEDDEEAGGEAGGRRHSATETGMVEKAVHLQLESNELKERLMVSEATVQAQAEQIKDYRDLLSDENEAEREEASSPEFDDLEMSTSLECSGAQWWSGTMHPGKAGPPTSTSEADNITSLQRLVEDLRSQLSRSQTVIRGLQGRLRSLSTPSEPSNGPSTPRKVNWGVQFSPAFAPQSGAQEDEGWGSSWGWSGALPRPPPKYKGLSQTGGPAWEPWRTAEKGQRGPPGPLGGGRLSTPGRG
ncbi:unnamed protein product, partial [Coregonus sp. 'balchen']